MAIVPHILGYTAHCAVIALFVHFAKYNVSISSGSLCLNCQAACVLPVGVNALARGFYFLLILWSRVRRKLATFFLYQCSIFISFVFKQVLLKSSNLSHVVRTNNFSAGWKEHFLLKSSQCWQSLRARGTPSVNGWPQVTVAVCFFCIETYPLLLRDYRLKTSPLQ
jgi:hypothetical protein